MTIAEARKIVRPLGYSLRKNEWNEYVLRLLEGATEANTYRTDDLDDAVGTAQFEHNRRNAQG